MGLTLALTFRLSLGLIDLKALLLFDYSVSLSDTIFKHGDSVHNPGLQPTEISVNKTNW